MSKGYRRSMIVIGMAIGLVFTGLLASQQKLRPPKTIEFEGPLVFDSNAFQSNMQNQAGLGPLAKDLSLYGKGDQAMGFAAKSDEAKTFLIGSFYSESLAYIRAGENDLALERLKALKQEFINMGVPSALYNFLSRIENSIAINKYAPAVLLDFFSLFQPFFEEYLASQGADRLTLFQAGSWLMDMGLAAAAQDKALLRQPERLNYFTAEMKKMDAPKGVQDALAEISTIAAKKEIAERDAAQVLKLIKRIQSVLG